MSAYDDELRAEGERQKRWRDGAAESAVWAAAYGAAFVYYNATYSEKQSEKQIALLASCAANMATEQFVWLRERG